MKKVVSILLALLLIASISAPAFAAGEKLHWSYGRSKVPIIRIGGDGESPYDAEGNKVPVTTNFFDILDEKKQSSDEAEGNEENVFLEASKNILTPLLMQGIIQDNWNPYYDALQKEISEIFEDGLLDENGNALEGQDIHIDYKNAMLRDVTVRKKAADGTFGLNDFTFHYDWRLDPLETADKLHAYIEGIKAVNDVSEVSLLPRCLGTVIAAAYLQKYGVEGIHGVGFLAGVVFGEECLSETISGKFKIDGNAINRYLIDARVTGMTPDLSSFVNASLELAANSGALDFLVGNARDVIYAKLYRGVTSALALSTLFTYPSYWACVLPEDYDEAMRNVFGPEGSEKRIKYAGLIEKIENYKTLVRDNLEDVLCQLPNNGKKIGVVAKYGYQLIPVCKSADMVGDDTVSLKSSSMGATTSTVYGTLSESYLSAADPKYISPDKQVDASTCLFKDNTWFVKGSVHTVWKSFENGILANVITADRQLTVDDFVLPQFIVCPNDDEKLVAPMTEENCNTYNWEADPAMDRPTNKKDKLRAFLVSLFKWLKEFFNYIVPKLNTEK